MPWADGEVAVAAGGSDLCSEGWAVGAGVAVDLAAALAAEDLGDSAVAAAAEAGPLGAGEILEDS